MRKLSPNHFRTNEKFILILEFGIKYKSDNMSRGVSIWCLCAPEQKEKGKIENNVHLKCSPLFPVFLFSLYVFFYLLFCFIEFYVYTPMNAKGTFFFLTQLNVLLYVNQIKSNLFSSFSFVSCSFITSRWHFKSFIQFHELNFKHKYCNYLHGIFLPLLILCDSDSPSALRNERINIFCSFSMLDKYFLL